MSNGDTENDHDYAATHLRRVIAENLHLRQVLRLVQNTTGYQSDDSVPTTTRNALNWDHNYNFHREGIHNNMSINGSGGTIRDDHDIFEDETTDAGNDILNSSSTSVTYETDIRTEDSVSTGETHSSSQTHSYEQTNAPNQAMSQQVTDSLPSSEQSGTDLTNETPEVSTYASISAVQEDGHSNNNANTDVISLDTPSPPKKRKRSCLQTNVTPETKTKSESDLSDDDDGLVCPICLDNWEMSGNHRLASLRCGHLFGDSCIRRWLQESTRQSGQKVCPQCKRKASVKDIRYLYAKRLRVIDRCKEYRMKEQLAEAQCKAQTLTEELATLKMSYTQVTQKLKKLEADNNALNLLLRNGGGYSCPNATTQKESLFYKLFLDRNVEISKEPGCRVLTYAEQQRSLIVSQKSPQNLFTGYGLRFIDTSTFKPTNFLHTSSKLLRDISLSDDQQLLAAACMETKVKLFDLRTFSTSTTFHPAEKPIWSCSLGRGDSANFIYLGSQHGSVYVYDTRFPEIFKSEHKAECDPSPVIQVESIPVCQLFPCGGFLVCKLTSMWIYEHSEPESHATRLPIEGRFISMNFDAVQLKLLIQTRSCARFPRARYILGKLNKVNEIPIFEIDVTFFASTNSPVMARCSQIVVESNTLVAAYIQDSKLLSLYDANREQCVQSLPAQDVIYDSCPIYTKDFIYLAALTETKCRLYKLNST